MPAIKVEVRAPGADLSASWNDLVARASANVFMHPVALKTAAEAKCAKIRVLLAWDGAVRPPRLIGLWALQETRAPPFGLKTLAAPPYNYALVSDPVIDPEQADEVAEAFLSAIERHDALPKIVRMKYLDGDSVAVRALLRALAARKDPSVTVSERDRPFAQNLSGVKRSGATRKKLRQDWNRLCALGSVEIENDRTVQGVVAAFEGFLAMEAESWKGDRGTALLCNPKDAAFAREFVSNLAAERGASVAQLRVDGRPVAAQVLLYCGKTAYTWKTAFDSQYRRYSPGAVLIDRLTEQFLATMKIEAIESCSPEGGFLGRIWPGRRPTIDLIVDTGKHESLEFVAVALWELGRERLRRLWNRRPSATRHGAPRLPEGHTAA